MARDQHSVAIIKKTLTIAEAGLYPFPVIVNGQIVKVFVKVGEGPVDGTALFDVHLNDTSIWAGDPSQRVTIPDGGTSDEVTGLAVDVEIGDEVIVDFDGFTGDASSISGPIYIWVEIVETGASATDAQLRDRSTHTGTQLASTISNFDEAVDDRIFGLILDSTSIDVTYNDVSNTLAIEVKDEAIDDRVNGLVVAGEAIKKTYDDGSNSFTIDFDLTELTELMTPDAANDFLIIWDADAGVHKKIKPENLGTGGGATDFTDLGDVPSDYTGQGEKFLAVKATEDGIEFVDAPSGSYTDEQAQDAVGGILADSSTINFTYTDATPEITAEVIDDSITDAKLRESAALSVMGRAANSTGNPADIVAGSNNQVLKRASDALAFGAVVEADITLADNTTNDVGTTKHGFAPKGDGDTSKFLNANGAYSVPGTVLGCRVKKSGSQSINNSTLTAITFDQEVRDDGGWHDNSTNNTRLTVPTGKDGWYIAMGQIRYAGNASGQRISQVKLNGTTVIGYQILPNLSTTDPMRTIVTSAFYLVATDYVELIGWHNITGGGTLNVEVTNDETWFAIVPAGKL